MIAVIDFPDFFLQLLLILFLIPVAEGVCQPHLPGLKFLIQPSDVFHLQISQKLSFSHQTAHRLQYHQNKEKSQEKTHIFF